jgi:hypothetical protein
VDICQASTAFGVFGGALAVAECLLGPDFCHNQRPPVFLEIRFDILTGIFKTVTDVLAHGC